MYENGYQQTGYQNAPQGNALGWDDDFEAQESTFVLLPEGDYWFEITKLERGRHNGSDNYQASLLCFCQSSEDSGQWRKQRRAAVREETMV